MSSRSEYAEAIWELWEKSGGSNAATATQVAQWVVNNGHYHPKPADLIEQCAEELKAGWREVYVKDKYGRSVRAMHAVTEKRGGEQQTIWTHLDSITRLQFELLMNQNRKRVVGEVVHMRLAADYYNENHPNEADVQVSFNFENDVRELTQVPIPIPAPGLSSSGR